MFISELMKINNLAVSVGDQYISECKNNAQVSKNLHEIMKLIKKENVMELKKIRENISNEIGNHNVIIRLNEFLMWGYIKLHIIDDDKNIMITMENSGYENKKIMLKNNINFNEKKLFMSRFTIMQREEKCIYIFKPMTGRRFVIKDMELAPIIIALFAGNGFQKYIKGNKKNAIKLMLNMFLGDGIINAINKNDEIPSRMKEGNEVEVQWDSADLLFHSSSRVGYHYGEFGGAFPFVNIIQPKKSVREIPKGKKIELYMPDIDELVDNDMSLAKIQLARMSVRAYDENNPISKKQIGEFLYRTARVMFVSEAEVENVNDNSQKTTMEFAWKPYPNGGASYELEIYLNVDRAKDIEKGMYYYDPINHTLIKICETNIHTQALIESAYVSCANIVRPQILIHIAARFQRVSWKYHAIAYATQLRNVGVLYQTFYLNAVAMGLAPCALGSGNTPLFAKATGNDPLVEGNVGEFMIGSLPKEFKWEKSERYVHRHLRCKQNNE